MRQPLSCFPERWLCEYLRNPSAPGKDRGGPPGASFNS
jgi:hypothetical protein